MQPLHQSIIETWQIHNRSMLMFVKELPEKALDATLSKRGGRNIARQLAHCISVRIFRLQTTMKKTGIQLNDFDKEYSPTREELLHAFEVSSELMESLIAEALQNDGKVSNFKRGVVPMIGYYITHEAHHKGHALLTMKTCGIPIPDSLKWGIWEWNKI
jgi:uncharacterized damage-inducible protein DinB